MSFVARKSPNRIFDQCRYRPTDLDLYRLRNSHKSFQETRIVDIGFYDMDTRIEIYTVKTTQRLEIAQQPSDRRLNS